LAGTGTLADSARLAGTRRLAGVAGFAGVAGCAAVAGFAGVAGFADVAGFTGVAGFADVAEFSGAGLPRPRRVALCKPSVAPAGSGRFCAGFLFWVTLAEFVLAFSNPVLAVCSPANTIITPSRCNDLIFAVWAGAETLRRVKRREGAR
jgi:hypothetical protein